MSLTEFCHISVSQSCGLKERLAELIPVHQAEVSAFRAEHGASVLGEVTVDQVKRSLSSVPPRLRH